MKTKNLTKRHVLKILDEEIAMYHDSYMERVGANKGKVLDEPVLRTIHGLEAAKVFVKSSPTKSVSRL